MVLHQVCPPSQMENNIIRLWPIPDPKHTTSSASKMDTPQGGQSDETHHFSQHASGTAPYHTSPNSRRSRDRSKWVTATGWRNTEPQLPSDPICQFHQGHQVFWKSTDTLNVDRYTPKLQHPGPKISAKPKATSWASNTSPLYLRTSIYILYTQQIRYLEDHPTNRNQLTLVIVSCWLPHSVGYPIFLPCCFFRPFTLLNSNVELQAIPEGHLTWHLPGTYPAHEF